MKKLFIALMAVCVLLSCGGSDNSAAKEKTPGTFLQSAADLMNEFANGVERASSAEQVVVATEKLAADFETLMNEYADKIEEFNKIPDEEVRSKYPDEFAAVEKATKRIQSLPEPGFEFSDSQKDRVGEAMQKVYAIIQDL